MKILHLTTHLNIGGITTYILRLIRPFRQNGIETFVLSSGGTCTAMLRAAGATVFELPIRTKSELNPKIYWAIPKIRRIIRENKIDILHAHTRVTQVVAFWIQKATGIPVVTTCHGFYKRRLGRRILPAWGDRVIGISQGVAGHLQQDHKVGLERIVTVNNGVDIEELDRAYAGHDSVKTKEEFGFLRRDPVVGIVARLVADKGHEYLIRAIDLLRKKHPDIRLLIVGDGIQKNYLQQITSQLELHQHVFFLGSVSDVTRPLAAIDIFAFPATWREGFGLSIVEAMACRKPVIVSNIWALNSLILDQSTGVLIEPKKIEPLAEAISELIRNPDKRAKIGRAGREMVEASFSVSRMALEIQQIYQGLLPLDTQRT